MQVLIDIDDAVWDEYLELDDKKERIEEIAGEALKAYIRRMRTYKNFLQLEGKVKWEGNLDELREMRI